MYFVGTYILTLQAFNNVPEIIDNIGIIFGKDACVENAIAFIRENQMLNYTVYVDASLTGTGVPEIGSTFILN